MRFSRPDDGIMRLEESFRFCARYIAGIIQDPGCFIFRLALGAPLVVVPHPRGSFPIGLSALLSAPAAFASCFALAASCHRESTPTRANSATPRLTSPAVHTIPPCTLVSADFLYIGRTDKKNTELWGKTDYFRFFFFFRRGIRTEMPTRMVAFSWTYDVEWGKTDVGPSCPTLLSYMYRELLAEKEIVPLLSRNSKYALVDCKINELDFDIFLHY